MTICKQYRNESGDTATMEHDPHYIGGYDLEMFDKYGQRIWKGQYLNEKTALNMMHKKAKGMRKEEV